MLVEEFFFHLVGAVEVLAQVINEKRGLGLDPERAGVRTVSARLAASDPIKSLLGELYPSTRSGDQRWLPLPRDPYSEEGSHFRIVVFNMWVNHCGVNPLHFRAGTKPGAKFGFRPQSAPGWILKIWRRRRAGNILETGQRQMPKNHRNPKFCRAMKKFRFFQPALTCRTRKDVVFSRVRSCSIMILSV